MEVEVLLPFGEEGDDLEGVLCRSRASEFVLPTTFKLALALGTTHGRKRGEGRQRGR